MYDAQAPSAPGYTPVQQPYRGPQPVYQAASEMPPAREVDSYAGQVPSGYAPEAPAGKKFPVAWMVVIVVLLLVCLCLAVIAWFAPKEFWCWFPVWPEGYCP